MKRLLSIFLLLTTAFCPLGYAEDPIVDDEMFYTEEDDQLFNKGTFVGLDDGSSLKAIRRQRNKNWAIAIGSTAIGVVTLILVGSHSSG